METIIWSTHVILAVALIVLVLLQQGKGADMGAAFGGGSSGSLFGASGSATFLSRMTGFIAAMFFSTSMGLTYFSMNQTEELGIMGTMGEIVESKSATELTDSESMLDLGDDTMLNSDSPAINDTLKANQIPN
ncbi:MAG: preprotein translocase subunit SecG [Nitrosomonas sp.]|nr:preprotein translocase subunit SecG [Nitrosomonas sp.]